MKISKCYICGNVVAHLEDSKVNMVCCGKPVKVLNANTEDGAKEKHVPVYTREGNLVSVTVGEISHPMDDNHYIGFIMLAEKNKVQFVNLKPLMEPKAEFIVSSDEFEIYEYCNLHGLYKTK